LITLIQRWDHVTLALNDQPTYRNANMPMYTSNSIIRGELKINDTPVLKVFVKVDTIHDQVYTAKNCF
jgi:hypothetical protein